MVDVARFLPFAGRLADAAAAVIRPHFRTPIAIEDKADASPVTIADRAAEEAMRTLIRAECPDHGIAGEEAPSERPEADLVWHLDPIDGTKSFVTGRPLFGTLVGLVEHGRPVLGVIDQCISGERWQGAQGVASTWNGTPIHTRPCPSLDRVMACATSPQMFGTSAERAAIARIEAAVRFTVFGGDCYAYGLLAMGQLDLIVEADLDPYDFMALVPVIEGAGGIVTDWQGAPITAASDGRIVAAGDPRIHAKACALLQADRPGIAGDQAGGR